MELQKHFLKDTLKSMFDTVGLKLYKTSTLPSGLMVEKDIERISGLNNVKTIFDVGGNIGQTAIHMSRVCPGAKIYSFEPISSTHKIFLENTKDCKNVESFNLALGEEEAKQTVHLQSYSWLNSLNNKVNKPDEKAGMVSEEVHIVRLDDFCDQKNIQNIDLLKIDTEGFDMNVLKGASKRLKAKQIKFIEVEVGFNADLDMRHTDFQEVSSYLAPYGFRLLGIYNQFVEFEKGHSHLEYADALFCLQR